MRLTANRRFRIRDCEVVGYKEVILDFLYNCPRLLQKEKHAAQSSKRLKTVPLRQKKKILDHDVSEHQLW